MSGLIVEHEAGDRFAVSLRGHRVVVDQPFEVGGTDSGPTPTELFVAGLAACVAFYGRRFLARHGLPDNVRVHADYNLSADRPARVEAIRLWVDADLPPARRAAFQRVVGHCTVHNTLRWPPEVTIEVQTGAQAA